MSTQTPGRGTRIAHPPGDDLRVRTGAHRPHRSPLVDLVPTVLVLLAVVAVAVGAWQLTRSTAATVASSGGPADSAPAGPRPSSTTSTPTGTASGTSSPSQSPTSSPTSTGSTVDQGQPLSVLNSTHRSGLASGGATMLRSAGWTIRSTGNYRSKTLSSTTVFYGADRLRATAQAVAHDVGTGTGVEQSAQFGADAVTVVLGSDYAP